MKHLLTPLAISILLFACTNKNTNTTSAQKAVSVDSLEKAWDDAFNAHDFEKFTNMIADDAIVFENEWMAMGKDSVIAKFVKPHFSHPSTYVMKTTKVTDGVSEGMVYRVGEYSDVKKDSAVTFNKGSYTLIWKKQADNNWRVEVLQTGTIK